MRYEQNLRNVGASPRPGCAAQGVVPIKPLPRYDYDQIMNTQNVPHRSQQTEVRIDVDA
jgi:hypothetical protein